jgi:hypothetical protein
MESEPMIIREKSFPKSWEDFLDKTHVDHELMTQLVKGYLSSEGFHDISQIMDEEAKEIGFAEKNESSEPTELQNIQRSVSARNADFSSVRRFLLFSSIFPKFTIFRIDPRGNFGRKHQARRVAD